MLTRSSPSTGIHVELVQFLVVEFGLQQVGGGHRDIDGRRLELRRRGIRLLLRRAHLTGRSADPDRRTERSVEPDVEEHQVALPSAPPDRRTGPVLPFRSCAAACARPPPGRRASPGRRPASPAVPAPRLRGTRRGAVRPASRGFRRCSRTGRRMSFTSRNASSRWPSRFIRSRYSIRFFLASPAMFLRAWSRASWM